MIRRPPRSTLFSLHDSLPISRCGIQTAGVIPSGEYLSCHARLSRRDPRWRCVSHSLRGRHHVVDDHAEHLGGELRGGDFGELHPIGRGAASASPTRISVTPALGRRRQLAHGQRHRRFPVSVDGDLEAVRPGVRERHVEHENRSCLDVGHPRGRLREVHGTVAAQDLRVLLVQEADLHLVLADLGALPLEPEYQVQARVHGGELLHPDVLKDPQHGQLAGLVDDRVVGDDGEVEMQSYFAETGIDARVFSHSSFNTPPFPFGSIAIVNCSTGCRRVSTRMSSRARSYRASYSVPHCPVFLLTMSFQPVGEGMVHRLYLPAGTAVTATGKSALVSRTVASFAPVRHTWFQGTTFPNTTRPRIEGRL